MEKMKLETTREELLKPLQLVTGVVERRQTLPILSNVLIKLKNGTLSISATDLEVELVTTSFIDITEEGETTLPARKILDICKTLPEGVKLTLTVDGEKALLTSGRSRFSLSTFPAKDFPIVDEFAEVDGFSVTEAELKKLIDRTQFSMAQQDVRHYLNGLMLELRDNLLISVATDGHRLSYCKIETNIQNNEAKQVIIPRKGIQELSRLLSDTENKVTVSIGTNHIAIDILGIKFTSKLIDGKFPDYERVLPDSSEIQLTANRETLRQALIRTSILSNEKYRGIRLALSNNKLSIQAYNPEQEKAEEEMEISYEGDDIEVGFNVNYLLDALSAIDEETVLISMMDPNSSCLVQKTENADCKYIIMPMRL